MYIHVIFNWTYDFEKLGILSFDKSRYFNQANLNETEDMKRSLENTASLQTRENNLR